MFERVALVNGFFAGIVGAILSHPADTIVSKLNSTSSKGTLFVNLSHIYSEIGFFGLWRGLNARICIIGPLVCIEFNILKHFSYSCMIAGSKHSSYDESFIRKYYYLFY